MYNYVLCGLLIFIAVYQVDSIYRAGRCNCILIHTKYQFEARAVKPEHTERNTNQTAYQ